MALETPPRFNREAPPARQGARAPRWGGDDAVPRGLAVASSVMLRLLILLGGLVLFAMAAQRLLIVLLPLLIAVLLATLLLPLAHRLERRGLGASASAAVTVIAAVLLFAGLWALVIPAAVSQGDELATRVQEGLGKVTDLFAPLGVDSRDLDRAVGQATDAAQAHALPVAMLAAQWAGATVLIVVLTFFFVRDGRRLWSWIVDLFHPDRHAALHELGERSWGALSTYIRGVFVVATIDAVFIGAGLLALGIPMALPLIVLTFIAAFFPILGATVAGAAAVLVALVSNGMLAAGVILALILVVQQLEGNVFYPVVVGRRLQLHPVAILLALPVGAVLAGVAGAFLAGPVISVGAAVLGFARERRDAREQAAVLTP
jgi:predicted PurR-regulated permease PerM